MKRFNLLLVGTLLSISASSAFAGTQWELATIEKISSNGAGTIHIRLDKQGSSTCDSKHVLLLPTANGKMNPLLSRAMFAYSTGEKLTISGTGLCQGEFEVVSEISRS